MSQEVRIKIHMHKVNKCKKNKVRTGREMTKKDTRNADKYKTIPKGVVKRQGRVSVHQNKGASQRQKQLKCESLTIDSHSFLMKPVGNKEMVLSLFYYTA